MESPIVKKAIEIIRDGDFELYTCNFDFLDKEQIYNDLFRFFNSYIYSNNFSPFSDQDVLHASNFCKVMMKIEKSPTYLKLKENGLENVFIENPICLVNKSSLCYYYLRRFKPTIYINKYGNAVYKLKECNNMKKLKKLLKESSNFGLACENLKILKKKQLSKIGDGIWSIKIVNFEKKIVTFRDILKILDEINK